MKYRKPRVDPYPVGSLVISMLNPSTPVYRQPVEYVLRCIYHWPKGEIGMVTGEPVDRKAPVLVNGIQGWVAMDAVRLTTETDDDVYQEVE